MDNILSQCTKEIEEILTVEKQKKLIETSICEGELAIAF